MTYFTKLSKTKSLLLYIVVRKMQKKSFHSAPPLGRSES
jgi:hypothetical protein